MAEPIEPIATPGSRHMPRRGLYGMMTALRHSERLRSASSASS